jgi:ferrous iron transport protein B
VRRVALVGNPNTGKTTLFNRLCGLRHKTSNFPGTTQEARVGALRGVQGAGLHLIDLPGVYSIELDLAESEVCRSVLAGQLAAPGEPPGEPDVVCVVLDAVNLPRNLVLAGEVLRRRLPTVVAVNMIDLARRQGLSPDPTILSRELGCPVVLISARTGEGLDALIRALEQASIPTHTPPGTRDGIENWAERIALASLSRPEARPRRSTRTDRIDAVLLHPVWGGLVFALVMAGLFAVVFKVATYPMDWIDAIFTHVGGLARSALPEGLLSELISEGVVAGVGATVVFLPQICLLFFLISLLEDTGYLARAAMAMDRVLRPFGLPGHAFVPLLSSHACALPGIMAARAVPDRRDRLATILVAPFMTCSARLPVYVLVTTVLFPDSALRASAAFVACYALGITAGLLSALVARRTILRGPARPMALELPTYKVPSLRTALLTTWDRGVMFLKKAGTNILAICIILWWLGAFPHVEPPQEALQLRAQADALVASPQPGGPDPDDLRAQADRLQAAHAKAHSLIGRLGRAVSPVFEPLGYDWRLTVGVLASFAAREVFVSTMAVLVVGQEDFEDEGVLRAVASARRDDGVTPVFTTATAVSLLVFFVLAMQCLPTLVVTARESGHYKWALLQFAWMSALAYTAALATRSMLTALGVP